MTEVVGYFASTKSPVYVTLDTSATAPRPSFSMEPSLTYRPHNQS